MNIKKILYVIFVLSSVSFMGFSQTRYLDDTYFTNVQIDSDLPFGSNVNDTGVTQVLHLDFYEPAGDTVSARPLIIWIHGGGYTSGTKTDSHMQLWCNEFARRGYVAASIDYRLGISGGNTGKLKAIYRSVQDAKAAIRYFRKYASQYRIDVNKIVLAGSSVGAFTAVHTAYWDEDEIPTSIDTAALGDLEGASGNPGYSSDPNAVVNFWGAIKDSTWIDAGEPMIVSSAGTLDSVVYPESHYWNTSGYEHGSIVIDRVAKSKNIPDTLLMFEGAKHTLAGSIYGTSQAVLWDTATTFATEFLYCNLISSCNTTGTMELNATKNRELSVYPIPAKELITVEYTVQGRRGNVLKIYNIAGKLMLNHILDSKTNSININTSRFASGIYFIQLVDDDNAIATDKFVITE